MLCTSNQCHLINAAFCSPIRNIIDYSTVQVHKATLTDLVQLNLFANLGHPLLRLPFNEHFVATLRPININKLSPLYTGLLLLLLMVGFTSHRQRSRDASDIYRFPCREIMTATEPGIRTSVAAAAIAEWSCFFRLVNRHVIIHWIVGTDHLFHWTFSYIDYNHGHELGV